MSDDADLRGRGFGPEVIPHVNTMVAIGLVSGNLPSSLLCGHHFLSGQESLLAPQISAALVRHFNAIHIWVEYYDTPVSFLVNKIISKKERERRRQYPNLLQVGQYATQFQ